MRAATLVLMVAAACSDPNADPVVEGDLAWEPCPLFAEGKDHPKAQCTTTRAPLWWDDPEGPTIELFAQRRITGDASRVLWMLPGGPGQSGAVFETYVKDLADELPDTDLYVFEHRGVGRSTRLGCPAQEADGSEEGIDVSASEWPDCLDAVLDEWGEDLAAFSSAAAADDLAAWIERTAAGREVFVYGGSYGTTLAHRFLQRHPDLADGVVLDSLALDVDHRVYDVEFDAVARGVLDLCAEDERCAEALAPEPEVAAAEAVAFADGGGCPAIDGRKLREGAAAFAADASLRGFAPSLFHRAGRCAEDDQEELERLIGLFEDREPHYTERMESPVLFANIELSEQWPEPWPTLEEVEEADRGTLFSFGLGLAQRPLLDLWPRYPFDPAAGAALAETDVPMLMLHGGLDPLTPLERTEAARAHFTGPGRHFVEFPEGTHILLGSTPSKGGDCATRLLAAFLDDPLAEPDVSCVDRIDPVDFDGQPLTSCLLFGDCSRYGNGCGGRGQAVLPGLLLGLVLRRRSRA